MSAIVVIATFSSQKLDEYEQNVEGDIKCKVSLMHNELDAWRFHATARHLVLQS